MKQLKGIFNDFSLKDESSAREAFRKLSAGYTPDIAPIKTIAFVGAYDAEIGGHTPDSRRLTALLEYLGKSGVPVDPDFEIDVINFRDKRDFLKETLSADLVFVSFILQHRQRSTHIYREDLNRLAEKASDYRPYFGCALSSNHYPETWLDRARQAGAKMVVTYGGSDEISTRTFTVPYIGEAESEYVSLIESPAEPASKFAVHVTGTEWDMESESPLEKIYSEPVDLPMSWLGICADKTYLKTIASGLNEETVLGRKGRYFSENGRMPPLLHVPLPRLT